MTFMSREARGFLEAPIAARPGWLSATGSTTTSGRYSSIPGPTRTIYAGATEAANAFAARFDAFGGLTFSTYLGGLHSFGSSVTVDRDGSIVVGGSAGRGFPLIRPLQAAYGGGNDAFVARIAVQP